MSETIIGPGEPCPFCFEDYGQHTELCRTQAELAAWKKVAEGLARIAEAADARERRPTLAMWPKAGVEYGEAPMPQALAEFHRLQAQDKEGK